jgi:hypothetical protein
MEADVWRVDPTDWSRYHGRPEGLSATDPRFSQRVELEFPDGSHASFNWAFAVEVLEEETLIVFTEHCGYFRVPLGDLRWKCLPQSDSR